MHPGAQIDEAPRPCHQRGQDERRHDVHREDMRQSVLGLDATRLAIADAHIVNDGIEAAEPIGLIGDAARTGNASDIALNDRLRLGQCSMSSWRARRYGHARRRDDRVPPHWPAIRPSPSEEPGDENAGHDDLLVDPGFSVARELREHRVDVDGASALLCAVTLEIYPALVEAI